MCYALRILIVDDEPGIQLLFEQVLSSVGYYVTVVGRSRQALAQVRSREFDVAVVDLSLPDEDGFEVIRQMRSASPYLKILAISGFMVGDVPHQALVAGATGTLLKPTPPETLLHTVYRLIEPRGTWTGDHRNPDEGGRGSAAHRGA
jgi:CheY-like chemotaxis protein